MPGRDLVLIRRQVITGWGSVSDRNTMTAMVFMGEREAWTSQERPGPICFICTINSNFSSTKLCMQIFHTSIHQCRKIHFPLTVTSKASALKSNRPSGQPPCLVSCPAEVETSKLTCAPIVLQETHTFMREKGGQDSLGTRKEHTSHIQNMAEKCPGVCSSVR